MTQDKTFGDLEIELADAKAVIAKFSEEKKANFIRAIKRFGNKYSDEELSEKTLESLEEIHDCISRFGGDLITKDNTIEKLPLGKTMPKRDPLIRVDFGEVFKDVNDDFNLDGFK